MDQNKQLEKYRIVRKETLAKECFRLVVRCPDIAKRAQAGQFAHIRAEGFLLRRPISICEIDRAGGTITLVFEVRGEGTKVISELREGDLIDMLAPLGNGFSLLPEKKAILIGGGIGTPPMLECAKFYGKSATVITGFRSASAVILQEEFKRTGAEVILCTDDGTGSTSPLSRERQRRSGLCLRPERHAERRCRPCKGIRCCVRSLAGRAHGLRRRRVPCLRLQIRQKRRRVLCPRL